MINYENDKGFGADSGLAFAEMAKEARNVSKTVRVFLESWELRWRGISKFYHVDQSNYILYCQ